MKPILFLIITTINLFYNQAFAIKENRIIRVGYVDYNKIINKLDSSGKIVSSIEDIQNSYKEKIQTLEKEILSLENNLENDPAVANINHLVNLLNEKRLELSILKANSQAEISKMVDNLLAPIKDKATQIIQQKAKQLGFDIIIDSSAVMIGKNSLDITNIILASL